MILTGKSLLCSLVRVAEMVYELNLQKWLCVRCVCADSIFFRLDKEFWTVRTCPKRTGFRTHAKISLL